MSQLRHMGTQLLSSCGMGSRHTKTSCSTFTRVFSTSHFELAHLVSWQEHSKHILSRIYYPLTTLTLNYLIQDA